MLVFRYTHAFLRAISFQIQVIPTPQLLFAFSPALPLQSPTFLLLLLTDPTRYLAASLNSPPVSSNLSGLPFALTNINSFGSSCLQSKRFPEPKVRCVCFWMWQQHTAGQRSCCQGWNSSTSLLTSSRYGLPAHTTVLKHTSNTAQTMLI